MTYIDHELHKSLAEGEQDRPVAPLSGIIYGDIIYWGTLAATLVVLIGSIITFVTQNNHIDPNYLLSAIWQGKSVEEIWQGAIGEQPNGHWYIPVMATGNGLTATGIALGVFSVIPGIVGSAVILFREKQYLFAGLAIVAASITGLAVVYEF